MNETGQRSAEIERIARDHMQAHFGDRAHWEKDFGALCLDHANTGCRWPDEGPA